MTRRLHDLWRGNAVLVRTAEHPGQRLEVLGAGTPRDHRSRRYRLAAAHRIVERHGGRIWAESSEGEGSTFFIELPSQGGLVGRTWRASRHGADGRS
jgi:hypothetical protein